MVITAAPDAVRDAAKDMGISAVNDFNTGDNEGAGYFHVNQKTGRRWSAARGFLKPARKRANLNLVTDAVTDKVVLDQGRPQVGGRPAPDTLSADMAATLAALLPVAQLQPSFKGFGSAKLWLGQRGIVMPLHYDASE